jgi:hypothetical protein
MLCQGDVVCGVPPGSQQLEMSFHSGSTVEEIVVNSLNQGIWQTDYLRSITG